MQRFGEEVGGQSFKIALSMLYDVFNTDKWGICVARDSVFDKRKDPPENKSIQNHVAYPHAKVLVIDPSPNRLVLEAAVNEVSRLLVEPAALGGRAAAVEVFRMLNLDMIPPDDRAFSSLRESALDAALACGSCRWPVSMQACGKMPVLPLEFVPDQHQ
jgi:hypothetical protein